MVGRDEFTFHNKSELEEYKKLYDVISSQLILGKMQLKVKSNVLPNSNFTAVSPNLEDVYFIALNQSLFNVS